MKLIYSDQVSHGSGITLEASQNAASLHALKCLAELGLESVSGGGGAPGAPAVSNNIGSNIGYTAVSEPLPGGNNAVSMQPPCNSFTNSFPPVDDALGSSAHSQSTHNQVPHNPDISSHHHHGHHHIGFQQLR